MKKLITSILAATLILFGLLLISNCKKDSNSESDYICETITISGESIDVCCNTTDCYYDWDGKKYYCNGQDCNDAAARLVDDILGGGKSLPIDNDTKTKFINKLLNLNR